MDKNALAISPRASPQVRQMIVAGDKILMSPSTAPVIRQMIAGSKTLVQGAVPFLAQLIMQLQARMGPLQEQDEAMLMYHLCGHFAEMVHELGDPEAKDPAKLTAQLMQGIHQMQTSSPQQPGQQGPMQQLQQGQPPQGAPQQ